MEGRLYPKRRGNYSNLGVIGLLQAAGPLEEAVADCIRDELRITGELQFLQNAGLVSAHSPDAQASYPRNFKYLCITAQGLLVLAGCGGTILAQLASCVGRNTMATIREKEKGQMACAGPAHRMARAHRNVWYAQRR